VNTGEFLKRTLIVAILIVGGVVFWMARDVMVSAFAAIMIAVAVTVPARWFEGRGMKRGWALLLSIVVCGLGLLLIAALMLPAIVNQAIAIIANLPMYVESAIHNYNDLRDSSTFFSRILPAAGNSAQTAGEMSDQVIASIQAWFAGGLLMPILTGLGTVFGVLFNAGLWLLIAIWLAADPSSYLHALLYLVPENRRERTAEIWNILAENLFTWIRAQSLSMTATAILVYVALGVFMGMPYAIVIAVLSAVATLIPNIGAFIPLIPIAVFGLASDTPERTIWWLLVYLLCQLLESNFITPSIVKVELHIPAGAMMIFQLIVAIVFGPLAMLLSVPFFTVIIVLVREIYSYDILGLKSIPVPAIAGSSAPPPLPRGAAAKQKGQPT